MTKKGNKGRETGGVAAHPRCLASQWRSLSGSKASPWCCRGAAVFHSPMSGLIHVLANMSWWGFRREGEEWLHTRVGSDNGLRGGNFPRPLESVDFELLLRGQSNLKNKNKKLIR